jgi:TolB-like protein/class 3 adenylate cyclase
MAKDHLAGKLAVILHADVAGSTWLVQQDEQLAHERIQIAFGRFSDTIGKYHGRVRELRGDALLAEFERASDAVTAALAFQFDHHEYLTRLNDEIRPEIRVGIALGEVIIADGTITGAGVVLAQRVEQLAKSGGICITSAIHEALPNRLPISIESLGEHALKGFDETVRVYRVQPNPDGSIPTPQQKSIRQESSGNWRWMVIAAMIVLLAAAGIGYWSSHPQEEAASIENMAFPLPDKPSIAVLPFTNMSDDPQQEYFADGMTEDLITDLSKISGLFVIARNSSFSYKGQQVKVRQVAEDLGVRYVLEGSVRRAGEQVRINAQLIDATTGGHLWAERYDGSLTDVEVTTTRTAIESEGEVEAVGESWIEGDRLCDRWPEAEVDLTICVTIFRDLESGQNNYYMVTDTGPHPFSVVN